ncbi:integrase [Vibrio sp. 1751]|uniref:integrase n=1 Tax=Vibrio TaxID=662 RepID=UPI00215C32CB|nr:MULTISPECIES: integrase [Vibrio]MCR9642250.1 integrase [Vibrio alginolyticus]MDW2099134.1 integrase [Vibrio sp. 1751]MDW2244410.1 integrase [Vibrio sp. 1287]
MTGNIIRFMPKDELTGKQNLNEFIVSCRTHLTAFGNDNWQENKWVTFKGKSKVVVRFSTNLKPSNSYHYEPLAAPFLDFAKAYIKNLYTDKPIVNLQRHMEAIRILEEALVLATGKADILLLDGTVLERMDEVFHRQLSDAEARNKVGYQMELMLNFCRSQLITPSLPEWYNPYSKVKNLTIALDDKGQEYRSEKLPTTEEMMLVAEVFRKAPQLGVEAEYFTALYALLMTAPSRGSEQTTLPVDCLVWEEDRAGDQKLGIRWVPAKKGKEGIKWVPTVMQDTVVEAVERLKRISAPARKAAKFAEEHPEKFMVHAGCITPEGFSDSEPLSIEQFNAAISTNYEKFMNAAPTPKWLIKLLTDNDGSISYNVLGKHEYEKYIKKFPKWPYIDKDKCVKASESLLLHRENEFHAEFNPRGFSFCIPTVNHVNDRFVQKESKGDRTLWVKHGFNLKNGQPIELNTHKARHWLSTMAESGGMDELTLANWAGRAKVGDNRKYDHRTEEEKAEQVAGLMISEDVDVLEKIKRRLPVTFEDIGKNLAGSAIVTELGVCEHDYAMSPCQRNGDCETCKEMVCIKGLSDSLLLLKKREKEVGKQLEKTMKDHEMGVFGSDRWVSSQGWRLAHIRTKIRILEDENTPDGTAVRIPDEYDPSPVKEVLMSKGLNTEIVLPDELGMADDVFELMEL